MLGQLLSEVRQLRLALQRSTFLSTRFQVAIERLRIQQGHVDEMNRELSGLRENTAQKESDLSSLVERRKSLEEQLDQVAGPDRTEMETNIRLLKAAAASKEKENQESRAREADLAARLRSDQARLEDLDRDLDALTKELKEP